MNTTINKTFTFDDFINRLNVTFNDTDTYENETIDTEDEDITATQLGLITAFFVYLILASVLSLCTFLFGLITWILIPKWRSFRTYVYLNVIFCYMMSGWLMYGIFGIDDDEDDLKSDLLFISIFYFINASSCWLFIGSMLIYTDIVIVFQRNIDRRMVKSNIFCWGIPLLLSLLHILGEIVEELSIFAYLIKESFVFSGVVLAINLLLYIRVLYCLFKKNDLNSPKRTCQKVQVATFTFLLTGAPILIAYLMSMPLENNNSLVILIPKAMPTLQTIILNICFLKMKSNRVSWCQRKILPRKKKSVRDTSGTTSGLESGTASTLMPH